RSKATGANALCRRVPRVGGSGAGKFPRRIAEIGREAWDACATNPAYEANPFIRFDFLDALEEANCAVERTGWGPQHLAVEDEAGRGAAGMRRFLKVPHPAGHNVEH